MSMKLYKLKKISSKLHNGDRDLLECIAEMDYSRRYTSEFTSGAFRVVCYDDIFCGQPMGNADIFHNGQRVFHATLEPNGKTYTVEQMREQLESYLCKLFIAWNQANKTLFQVKEAPMQPKETLPPISDPNMQEWIVAQLAVCDKQLKRWGGSLEQAHAMYMHRKARRQKAVLLAALECDQQASIYRDRHARLYSELQRMMDRGDLSPALYKLITNILEAKENHV